jgi:putative transposon-encoded protein
METTEEITDANLLLVVKEFNAFADGQWVRLAPNCVEVSIPKEYVGQWGQIIDIEPRRTGFNVSFKGFTWRDKDDWWWSVGLDHIDGWSACKPKKSG